jgi:hypothetical protein
MTLALGACGGQPSTRVESQATKAAPAPAPGDVLEYVPSAGLRWLLVARPAKIAQDPALSTALAGLVPPERLEAYRRSTGVDLAKLLSATAAGYELGILYVAELPSSDTSVIRERFASRLTHGGIVKQARPDVYRVSGTEDDTPLALVTVDNRLVAYARGDLTLARIVEAYAARKLKSPPALRGAALSSFAAPADDVTVAFYAPGPFTEPSPATAPRLLGASTGLAVMIKSPSGAALPVTATLAGDWSDAPDARDELLRLWSHLAASSTGRLLGLDAAKNAKATGNRSQLQLSVELELPRLIEGLRALTSANVQEIFGIIEQKSDPLPGPKQ